MMHQLIIDVREPEEYERGHVEGAINIPPSEIMSGTDKLNNVPKDAQIILYCLSGARSNASMAYLKRLGFTNLINGINKDQVESRLKKSS